MFHVAYIHSFFVSSAVDLLKQMKDNFCNDDMAIEVLFDEVCSPYFHYTLWNFKSLSVYLLP